MIGASIRYAHSLPGRPTSEWEPLAVHLQAVAARAAEFATPFGWADAAYAAGALHDVGKASAAFQAYIRGDEGSRSPDHSTAGAVEAVKLYGDRRGRLIAFLVAGHHAGLADGLALTERLGGHFRLSDYSGWEAHAPPLPAPAALAPSVPPQPGAPKGFAEAFLTRMLFSCLVDADFLETEKFYGDQERGGFASIEMLSERLTTHLERFRGAEGRVNRLRAKVLAHAMAKAALTPGLFTLTVPTGGGKTLTSLKFALEHARRYDLRRIVYVIPYTSIIEQTAEVFRTALNTDADVLEHHASFDWEADLSRQAGPAERDGGQVDRGSAKLRRAAENWDAPVIVTTAVQFFESLFANRTSRCRKLHNLAGSVIVLDEAQTLPLPLLRPCLAALEELARNYGASALLCTATQPAVRAQDGFKAGLDIPCDRELAPDPPALYAALKRVAVERRPGTTTDGEIGERFATAPQMLAIVNSRAHAHDLFTLIRNQPGAVHLSTLMCPAHRRSVLADLRQRLKTGHPVRLVATSLIEAGVDVDFPEVWRAVTGLDSIAQAAGRCNREGAAERGRVVVFTPAEHKPPYALRAAQEVAAEVLDRHPDPLTIGAVTDYFRRLYWTKGAAAFDKPQLDGKDYPILPALKERAQTLDFPFCSIGRAFRMIDETMDPVIVPWDERARRTLASLAATDRALSAHLRTLQQYVVPVPSAARAQWMAKGAIAPVHSALGDTLLAFSDLALYDTATGVRLADPAHRSAESNIL